MSEWTEHPVVKSWLFEIFSYPYDPDPAKFDPRLCKELYDWKLESWVAAEELGFDGVFFSEHHFTPYSISPSPNLLVATLAQRTSRMNIGVMANITAFHNPRRLAEEGAMLDHLTGGRLEVGMGRGVDEPEFLREGIKMEETRARFEESVALIQAAWKQPTFTFKGEFYNYDNVGIWPRPLRPNLPIWVTALSPQTVSWAAKQGFRFTSVFSPTDNMRSVFEGYKKAAAEAGRDAEAGDMGVCRNVVIADSEQEARDLAEPAFDALFAAFKEAAVFHDLDNVPTGYEHYQSFFRPFAGESVSFDALIEIGAICVGTPETVRDQIVSQVETIGCGHFLNWGSFGNLTKEQTMRSYQLFGEHVVPALHSLNV
ncbi:LLM class flavin-dependent oxidoreductase [Amycolatopsis sp. GM8]|uniref:LLM class flavin-dependent oxidoreductase n=1 Tax=Amycolatopsis sp. GM8 TaxID=2896530 RepID=UPI001F452BDF|nr:LLM class flavin-dependent oxidoreductase [Amycolatopsis sp. GM8]